MNRTLSLLLLSCAFTTMTITQYTYGAETPETERTIAPTQEVQMDKLKFEKIVDMATDLISKLPQKKWTGILAITRGGLAPAAIVSQYLDIRRVEVINVKSYDEKTQGALEILNAPNLPDEGEDWLVIDDLSDSGKTLNAVRALYPKAYITALLTKPNGKDAPDLYSREFPQNVWIHFPWEPLNSTEKSAPSIETSEEEVTIISGTQKIQMNKLKFEKIVEMATDLISKLPQTKWSGILAITRGGLAPAAILSQYLDIRRVEVINIKSYDEKTQGALEILNAPQVPDDGEGWLVIDDLSDSGKTLKAVRALYPKAYITALLTKPNGKEAPDLYSREFPQNVWIHFPWEPISG